MFTVPTQKNILILLAGFVSVSAIALCAYTASAAPNLQINYQGKLTDSSDATVSDGDYAMTFSLYTAPTGGSSVWTESSTSTVTNGLFSIMLGSSTSLASVDFDQTLYLGINVEEDGEMSPRKILGTVPAAFEAVHAADASTLGGVASTSFLRSDQADTASGLLTFTGGFVSQSSSTISGLTTNTATTTNFIINSESFTDLTGTGLSNNSGVLTLNTTLLDTLYATTTDFDTSAELATILTDETGAGNAVFSASPTFTGTIDAVASDFSGTLTLSGSAANIALGSNYLSGDGDDEGVYVDSGGNVGVGTTSPASKLDVRPVSYASSQANGITLGNTTNSLWDTSIFLRSDSSGFPRLSLSGPGGAEGLIIDTSGNIGIGTTTPAQLLHIAGNTRLEGLFYDADNSAGTPGMLLQTTATGTRWVATSTLGISGHDELTLAGSYDYLTLSGQEITLGQIDLTTDATGTLAFANGGTGAISYGANRLLFVNAGNTAFTSAADFLFDGSTFSTPGFVFADGVMSITSVSTTTIPNNSSNAWVIATSTGGQPLMRFDTTSGNELVMIGKAGGNVYIGDVGMSSNLIFEEDSVIHGQGTNTLTFGQSGDIINFVVDVGLGTTTASNARLTIQATSSNDILSLFETGGAEVVTVLESGNVGIGTTSPVQKLSVDGNLSLTGALYDNFYSAGLSGYVLQSSGAGLSWVATSTLNISEGVSFSDSAGLAAILSDETGSAGGGLAVFSISPTLTGTLDAVAGDFSSTLTLSGSAANIALGSNYLSGDGDDEGIYVGVDGKVGIGTSSPQSNFDLWGLGSGDIFTISSSTGSQLLTVTKSGYVGIGTTTPQYLLSVDGSIGVAYGGAALSVLGQTYPTIIETGWDGSSDYVDIFAPGDNNGGTPGISLLSSGNVGVGTTSPSKRLQVFETVADDQFRISYDATRYADFQVDSVGDLIIDAQGGDVRLNDENLHICSGGACPSGISAGTGNVMVENDLYVAAGGASGLGQATSTFQGDLLILGKLDVGTIDPIYRIDETKYATYGMSSVGIKESLSTMVQVTDFNNDTGYYEKYISWSELEKESDLWLFYQVTDFGTSWESLIVSLTTGFDGKVFYTKDIEHNALVIQSTAPGEVSASLSANRFDWQKWGNLRPDQDSPVTHFELESKQ